jgi:tight adherence protein C
MVLLLLIGLCLTATAVALVARGLIASRLRAEHSLAGIDHYGFAGAEVRRDEGLLATLEDVAGAIGTLILRQLRFGNEDHLRRMLVSAGMYRLTPRMLMGYQVLGAVVLPSLWIWFALAAHASAKAGVIVALLALGVGYVAPPFIVRQRGDARLAQIDYDVPDLIDLLVVMVEAGLGLAAALQLAAERLSGALGDELRIVVQEQRMGLPSIQALENMAARCPTPAVRTFAQAMGQGERLGVSIGQIMRSQALEMRKRRRAAAEEKAHKAPIKMLFPLIFMIFPAMFVVLLGPALISIFNALGSK